jgi:hypothetical protein
VLNVQVEAEKPANMHTQYEVFQQLLRSDTDDYSVAHDATGTARARKRSKVDDAPDTPGTSSLSVAYCNLLCMHELHCDDATDNCDRMNPKRRVYGLLVSIKTALLC